MIVVAFHFIFHYTNNHGDLGNEYHSHFRGTRPSSCLWLSGSSAFGWKFVWFHAGACLWSTCSSRRIVRVAGTCSKWRIVWIHACPSSNFWFLWFGTSPLWWSLWLVSRAIRWIVWLGPSTFRGLVWIGSCAIGRIVWFGSSTVRWSIWLYAGPIWRTLWICTSTLR